MTGNPGQCSALQDASSYGEQGSALPELLHPALSLSSPIYSGTQEPERKEEWYVYSARPGAGMLLIAAVY